MVLFMKNSSIDLFQVIFQPFIHSFYKHKCQDRGKSFLINLNVLYMGVMGFGLNVGKNALEILQMNCESSIIMSKSASSNDLLKA